MWNRKEELMTPSREKPLTRDEIHARLWKLTAKQFDKDPANLRPEQRITQDLGADSLDVAELGMALEEELGVVLPDDLLGNPNLTLGDVEQALWEKCSGKG
jgi:acyl carrier protein